ncbi:MULTISPECIES: PTS sugar transporter subunit IIA [Pseudonocardia]|uniref:PTS system glucose-specific EIICBA component n=2 Tax=Pseudonocardia TaxID=1847 RepID=A0A1Y2N4M9_PSEAH|nr:MULTISPECIES: PTS glucose transporter subunit IIA [Pseudonocardia]OSY42047.1 PTS system glucose-specific EIICBA component [Pseudonocardia autotrophica]TDN75184.1 PTS system N-acetylglucosamine-specific IIA component (Glc family) [Pseudonocardia autotrophica]BBF99129.1 PTS glucose transporter subunit IIA [Pseudonocardia autotrophica]GEC24049.1 PTS glucose transporter subunit IIA [Pseudonocardia saturnea]
MTLYVAAPVAGRVVPLPDVPDPVFAEQMLGSGLAIEPPSGSVHAVAPIAGTLAKLHPHAYVVVGDDGAGVLVHLGIDTVGLAAFTLHAGEGDSVGVGQPVVTMDADLVRGHGLSAICPVVLMDSLPDGTHAHATGDVRPGDPLFSWDG